jgi:phosphodiesterase/alkaline phosphatase D-like protein
MNKLLLRLAVTAAAGSLLFKPIVAQVQAIPKAASVRITEGPAPERADDYLTIITWTSNNPGGSLDHLGVVHYGTDPKNLSQTAKSPNRLNAAHSSTIFRVRIEGLKPGTTYYYTVDSEEPNGKGDGVKIAVKQFTVKQSTVPGTT